MENPSTQRPWQVTGCFWIWRYFVSQKIIIDQASVLKPTPDPGFPNHCLHAWFHPEKHFKFSWANITASLHLSSASSPPQLASSLPLFQNSCPLLTPPPDPRSQSLTSLFVLACDACIWRNDFLSTQHLWSHIPLNYFHFFYSWREFFGFVFLNISDRMSVVSK